jgi:peptide/nickel transport system permease protein
MFRYVLKRLIQMIPLLLIISFLSFGVSKLAPGDYLAKQALNPHVSAAQIEAERHRLGLDKPWYVQYGLWLYHFSVPEVQPAWPPVTWQWGESFTYNAPVTVVIGQRLGATLLLGIAALLFTWLIALPLGIYSAVRQYSFFDKLFSAIAFVALGIPDFFLALVLLLLAAQTGWFPIGGRMNPSMIVEPGWKQAIDVAWHMIVPTIAVGIGSIAILQRRMRGNLLDVLGEEYIRTARAKGLPEGKVIYRHAVRNALNPIITLLGFELGALLSGFALVENVVGWPGLGFTMLHSMLDQDIPLTMAGLMIGAIMLLLGNLAADLMLAGADPRIKLEA